MVHEGQSWKIECDDLKKNDLIRWTRNGQTLEPELSSGQLVVLAGTSSSTLSASQATDSHDGDYKCTSDSPDSFHLMIYSGTCADIYDIACNNVLFNLRSLKILFLLRKSYTMIP